MNYPAAELRGIKDVIPACPESFFALMYAPEGCPTSVNDRIRRTVTPKLSFEEFF
jgi:hypothetical protein